MPEGETGGRVGLLVYGLCRDADAVQLCAASTALEGDALSPVRNGLVAGIVGPSLPNDLRIDLGVLRRFQSIVEALHRAGPLVPAGFASALDDEAALQRVLRVRERALVKRLALIDGCDEWTIRVRPPQAPAAAPVSPASPTGPPADPTGAAAHGAAYLRARREHYDRAAGIPPGLRELVAGPLALVAALARVHRLEGPSEAVPLPAVHLLVPRESAHRLRAAAVDAERALGSPVLLTGPWPAFNFAEHDDGDEAAA